MSFWSHLQSAAGLGVGLQWVVFAFLAVSVALLFLAPASRIRIAVSVIMLAAAMVGLVVAAGIATWGNADSAGFRWIRNLSLLVLGFSFVNLAGVLVFKVLLGSIRLEPPPIMRDLILAVAYIVIVLSLLSNIGVNLTGIVATSAVVTAVIGFSLQDTLGNIMGGMALQLERSISVGDWVRIGDQEGIVKEIRWRQTSIETRNWDTIVIPNGQLMKSQVIVLGKRAGCPRQHRQWVRFNVDFRYSPTRVIATVEVALRKEPIANVAADPPPNCVLAEFKESYGQYAVRYWLTDLLLDAPTDSSVRARIYSALRRAGMSLSIPAQTLFVTEDDEARRQRKSDEERQRRVSALRGVELFQPLTDEERSELAARLRLTPFISGETITRQGGSAHDFYILTSGSAEVRVAVDGGVASTVATIHGGDFFGEMGLLTGSPRSATIVAQSDAVCYRLDKEAFMDILQRRPEIAEQIAQILARRRAELDAVREGLTEEATRQRARSTQGDLLRRIKSFFTLKA